jgi:hypothetical protein
MNPNHLSRRDFLGLLPAGAMLAAGLAPGKSAATELPAPAPLVPSGAWKPLLNGHARLLGGPEFLKARAKEMPDLYNAIKQDRGILAVGIVHAVEGADPARIQPHVDEAMKNAARGATNAHQDTWIWMDQCAFAYDYFHDRLTPPERAAIVEFLNKNLDSFTTDESAFHNSTPSKALCYLHCAYATWGENPRAEAFRDHALEKLYEGKMLPVLKRFGEGGGWTDCGWYSRHAVWHLVQALELARRFEGYEGFLKAPRFFHDRMAFELHSAFPGAWTYGTEQYPTEGDGSHVYGGHTEYPRHTRTVLAQYWRGTEIAGFVAAKRRRGSNLQAQMVDFLWAEKPDPARPLAEMPAAHLASGIGHVYARSDWSDDATYFRFSCGPYFTGHQHFDVGNFEIFRREQLATESGEYVDYMDPHAVNWLMRTIAHNCVLVHKPDEQWPRMRDGGRNRYANDGGQAHKWEWPADNLPQWEASEERYQRGRITAHANRPEFLYVAADCTAAYDSTKLERWVRQVVFLRPHSFVILDRVVSAKPEYVKTWLLHCRNKPEITGSETRIENGAGRLLSRTLLPAKANIRSVEGYTYGGQTFNPAPSGLSATANRWRVEVQPDGPRKEDFFLHALFTDAPKETRLLRTEPSHVGVTVGDDLVVLNVDGGGRLTIAGKKFDLPLGVEKVK